MHTAIISHLLNPLSANFTKWSNTLKQFVGNLATNCLSVFDHFVGLALKGLIQQRISFKEITPEVCVVHTTFIKIAGGNV